MTPLLRIAFPKFERFPQIESWFLQAGLPIEKIERPGIHSAGDPWDCGMDIECFAVSHVDVATYVERGVAHLGVMESNKILETKCEVWSPYTLPFGRYPIVFAAPRGQNLERLTSKPVLRLATSMPDLTREWFIERGILTDIVEVHDSPDAAVLLGLADAFVCVLDEHHELDKHGFSVIEVIGHTELKLIANNACGDRRRLAIRKIINVLKGLPVVDQVSVEIPFEEL